MGEICIFGRDGEVERLSRGEDDDGCCLRGLVEFGCTILMHQLTVNLFTQVLFD